MKISVIVPTYNEEDVILECLESLNKQTYKNYEVVVVDDGSTDDTLGVIRNFQLTHARTAIFNFQLLEQKHEGPGSARNLGAKHATGKILVFVDSDMTFAPDFLGKLIKPILEGKTKGTFSKEELVANPGNIWSACWAINEGWEKGKRHPKNYPDRQKVFRAILKSEFDRVGGFTSSGEYTDDWSLSKKLGYLADNAPDAKFYHKNPESMGEIFKQAKWIGKRRYKFWVIGKLVALLRVSLPVPLLVGLVKSVVNKKPQFLIFKIVYDFGIFVGVLTSLFGGKSAK